MVLIEKFCPACLTTPLMLMVNGGLSTIKNKSDINSKEYHRRIRIKIMFTSISLFISLMIFIFYTYIKKCGACVIP